MLSQKDIDGGWAYVVLASSCLCLVILTSVSMSVGMLQTELFEHFPGNTSFISFICALMLSMHAFLGIVAGIICQMFSVRVAVILGASILSVGLVASSLAENVTQLLLLYGILSGIGLGILYTPCATVVNHYFEKNRPLANGIALSSSGIGYLSGPYLIAWLLETLGWRHTLVVMSCITLQMCILGSLFFPIKGQPTGTCISLHACRSRHERSPSPARGRDKAGSFSIFLFLKNKFVWILYASYTMLMVGHSTQIVHFPSYVKYLGIPFSDIPLLYTMYGVTLVLARLLGGMFCNSKEVSLLLVYTVCQFAFGLAIALMPIFADSFPTLGIYITIIAIYYGCSYASVTPLLVQYVGLQHISMSFGALFVCGGVGYVIGPSFAGWLFATSASYTLAFNIAGLVIIAGSVLLLLIPVVVGKPLSETNPIDTQITVDPEENEPLK